MNTIRTIYKRKAERLKQWAALWAVTALLFESSVTPVFAAGVAARLESNNGSTSFEVKDSGDVTVGRIDSNGNMLLIGTGSASGLQVAGYGTSFLRVGDPGCGINFVGITLNGQADDCLNYNIGGSSEFQDLFINRPVNYSIRFRENNVDQMTIKNGGYVGIGTEFPSAKLHSFSAAGTSGPQMIVSTGTTSLFEVTGTSITIGAGNELTVKDGKVGIGTINPSYALDVFGSVRLAGNQGTVTVGPEDGSNEGAHIVMSGAGSNVPFYFDNVSGGGRLFWTDGNPHNLLIFNSGTGEGGLRVEGNSMIGGVTTVPQAVLHVASAATRNAPMFIVSTGTTKLLEVNGSSIVGNVNFYSYGTAFKPGGGSWTDSSDLRLKKNVQPLAGPLDKMLSLRGVNYEWREPGKRGRRDGTQMGMIAQDVEKVFPEWVGTDGEGYKTLTFSGFESLTVESMREIANSIKELKDENSRLKQTVASLESTVGQLKGELTRKK